MHSISRLAVTVAVLLLTIGCEKKAQVPATANGDSIGDLSNSVPLSLKTPKPLDVSFIPTDAVVALASTRINCLRLRISDFWPIRSLRGKSMPTWVTT